MQATYLAGTGQIDLTSYSRITRLELVVTPQILIDQLNQYLNITGQGQLGFPNNTQPSGNGTSWEIVGGYTLTNVTDVIVIQIEYSYNIYVNPQTGEQFYLFPNNTVINATDGSVLSYTGGLQWIIDFLNSQSQIEGFPGYETYTLLNGTIFYLYANGSTTDSNGNVVVITGGLNGLLEFLNPPSPVYVNGSQTS